MSYINCKLKSYMGITVLLYHEAYTQFNGLKGIDGVNYGLPGQANMTYSSKCGRTCFGHPNHVNDCPSMKEHILRYLDAIMQGSSVTGFGTSTVGWPVMYLNTHQYNQLMMEDVGGNPPEANRVVAVHSGPVTCTKCRFKNEYGAPNQKDGTYVCYMCR